MISGDPAQCARCQAPILDPTTQVLHGASHYCCTNCSEAEEQWGAGSDPHAPQQSDDPHCTRCNAPLVDEATVESRGDGSYCCRNCAAAAGQVEHAAV